MVRYPHTIDLFWKSEPVKSESTGTYGAPSPLTLNSVCHAKPAGEGKQIMGADGNMTGFSFEVFLPLQSVIAPFGADVTVNIGAENISGRLKRMHNYQTFSKIWL